MNYTRKLRLDARIAGSNDNLSLIRVVQPVRLRVWMVCALRRNDQPVSAVRIKKICLPLSDCFIKNTNFPPDENESMAFTGLLGRRC